MKGFIKCVDTTEFRMPCYVNPNNITRVLVNDCISDIEDVRLDITTSDGTEARYYCRDYTQLLPQFEAEFEKAMKEIKKM